MTILYLSWKVDLFSKQVVSEITTNTYEILYLLALIEDCIISFNLHKNLLKIFTPSPHFTDEETEARGFSSL